MNIIGSRGITKHIISIFVSMIVRRFYCREVIRLAVAFCTEEFIGYVEFADSTAASVIAKVIQIVRRIIMLADIFISAIYIAFMVFVGVGAIFKHCAASVIAKVIFIVFGIRMTSYFFISTTAVADMVGVFINMTERCLFFISSIIFLVSLESSALQVPQ